jgi:hypothetical protein
VSGPALVALDIAGTGTPWGELGLMVADEVTQVGDVTLRFGSDGEGIVGWALHGPDGPADLDGLRTTWLPEPITPNAPRKHRLELPSVDHVVIATPDPRRTFRCFQSAGLALKREREGGTVERPLVQGFFRHGEATVEVVGPREVRDDGPARFWGLTLVAGDLEAAVTALGDERCWPIRDAVQPGRRIATLRRGAGLPARVALISPAA